VTSSVPESSQPASNQSEARPRVVAVVGNPRPGSRTATLATALAQAVADLVNAGPPVVLDLAELTEKLGPPLGPESATRWAEPLEVLHAADLLVIATPTYKGSYTGLLKSFLDHVGGGALHPITAIPVTTVGSPAHTLAADLHLRPLLVELGASTPTSALVVGNDQLDDPAAAIATWVERNDVLIRRALTDQPPAGGAS
jgi:FMN reductase